MVTWKELAYKDDVASLSAEDPHAIGTTAAAGAASDASKHDHVHALGASVVDNSTVALTAGVLSVKADGITGAQIADDAVGSEHIETLDAALDFGGQIATDMIIMQSSEAPVTPVIGKIYQDSDDGKTYICTVAT